MRVATWNVNSLTARFERVAGGSSEHAPDVLCLQETKQDDAKFPFGGFKELGYEVVHHGEGRWNGVAIASRVGIEGVRRGFGTEEDDERREVPRRRGAVGSTSCAATSRTAERSTTPSTRRSSRGSTASRSRSASSPRAGRSSWSATSTSRRPIVTCGTLRRSRARRT